MTPPAGRPKSENPRLPASLRLTAEEKALVEEAAGAVGKPPTVWMQEQVVAAARRSINRAAKRS